MVKTCVINIMATIYLIQNSQNGKRYIGSSKQDVKYRWRRHLKDLRAKRHHSIYLQRAWNKYGAASFSFKVLEQVPDKDMLNREQFWINSTSPEYNMCLTAGNCAGRAVSAKTRLKISLGNLGKTMPLDARSRISATHTLKYGKDHVLISPKGEEVHFRNIRSFAKQHGVFHTGIGQLLKGGLRYSQGWTNPKFPLRIYCLRSPSGEIYSDIRFLKEFCLKHDLNYKCVNAVCNGSKRSWRGWTAIG
jgi:hypothetical protein